MTYSLVGLESSSIMPLVAVTPLTQSSYEIIWGRFLNIPLIAHEDSINELKNIFNFKANTFYSNPIKRLEKIKELSPVEGTSLKGVAMKLLLDGQSGGWIGNKNSRVQAFFFSDVIDSMDNDINNAEEFCCELIVKMKKKVETYNNLLTPSNEILTIDVKQILPYWGFHNISSTVLLETETIKIKIKPDCESFKMFGSRPTATRRDAYRYHMLKSEKVDLILVGDANYKKNICSCQSCIQYHCDVLILTDKSRKVLLN